MITKANLEDTVLRVSKCLRQWHTDRLQATRELQRISRRFGVNSRHKLSLILAAVCQSQLQTPAYAMVLARGYSLLTKQAYLSTISLICLLNSLAVCLLFLCYIC